MRFYIDGRFDVRPLGTEDKAHTPLPYDFISVLGVLGSDIISGTVGIIDLTDSDWGADKDFYIEEIIFGHNFPDGSASYESNNQGLLWEIFERIGSTNTRIYSFTMEYQIYPPLILGTSDRLVFLTVKVPALKVNASNTLRAQFANYTGDTVETNKIEIVYVGTIHTP